MVVDDQSGEVEESWTGHQVAWRMARGYAGAFGRKLNAPYVWLPLCAIFVLGLLDWRRPFRVAHLDLLVIVAGFGVSHYFFNRGEIGVSVPLAYPPLLYLLGRALWLGFRGGAGLRPTAPALWLAVITLFLVGVRVGLNVADSNVIDVGYSGVIGADKIADGEALYGSFPAGQPLRRHLRPRQLLRLRPLRAAVPLERKLGRPPRRPRGGDLLRSRHPGRPLPARPPAAARGGGENARHPPLLRLGRLPLHGLRPRVEHQRRPRLPPPRPHPPGDLLATGSRNHARSGLADQIRPIRLGTAVRDVRSDVEGRQRSCHGGHRPRWRRHCQPRRTCHGWRRGGPHPRTHPRPQDGGP